MTEQAYTAAIVLGASSFPLYDGFTPSPAFLRSKQGFRSYLQDSDNGLSLPDEAVLDLFDSHHNATNQLLSIGKFLERVDKETDRNTPRNLLLYYVGHGYFSGQRQEYYLALASLTTGYEATTGLKVTDLADVIKDKGRVFRRFVFLDCCFAAEALPTFMGAPNDAMAQKVQAAFAEDTLKRPIDIPLRGTALFCAADKDHVALSPVALKRTMFSDSLLDVLASGDKNMPSDLTLADVFDLTWEQLQKHSPPVRPVLHSPDQTQGDIAKKVFLFPNVAHKIVSNTVLTNSELEMSAEYQALLPKAVEERPEVGSLEAKQHVGEKEPGTTKTSATQKFTALAILSTFWYQIESLIVRTRRFDKLIRWALVVSILIFGVLVVISRKPEENYAAINPIWESYPPGKENVTPSNQKTGEKVTLSSDVFFDVNKITLRPEFKRALDQMVEKMAIMDVEIVIVIGHADASDGLAGIAQKLSEDRASSVKDYLTSKGIPAKLIYTEGKYSAQPAPRNSTSANALDANNAKADQSAARVDIEVVGTLRNNRGA